VGTIAGSPGGLEIVAAVFFADQLFVSEPAFGCALNAVSQRIGLEISSSFTFALGRLDRGYGYLSFFAPIPLGGFVMLNMPAAAADIPEFKPIARTRRGKPSGMTAALHSYPTFRARHTSTDDGNPFEL